MGRAFSVREAAYRILALGALFDYLSRTQITGLERMSELELASDSAVMGLDLNAEEIWS